MRFLPKRFKFPEKQLSEICAVLCLKQVCGTDVESKQIVPSKLFKHQWFGSRL